MGERIVEKMDGLIGSAGSSVPPDADGSFLSSICLGFANGIQINLFQNLELPSTKELKELALEVNQISNEQAHNTRTYAHSRTHAKTRSCMRTLAHMATSS